MATLCEPYPSVSAGTPRKGWLGFAPPGVLRGTVARGEQSVLRERAAERRGGRAGAVCEARPHHVPGGLCVSPSAPHAKLLGGARAPGEAEAWCSLPRALERGVRGRSRRFVRVRVWEDDICCTCASPAMGRDGKSTRGASPAPLPVEPPAPLTIEESSSSGMRRATTTRRSPPCCSQLLWIGVGISSRWRRVG